MLIAATPANDWASTSAKRRSSGSPCTSRISIGGRSRSMSARVYSRPPRGQPAAPGVIAGRFGLGVFSGYPLSMETVTACRAPRGPPRRLRPRHRGSTLAADLGRAWRLPDTQLDEPDRPFYNLMMFPYPSAEGLHVGHIIPFAGGDIYGRWRRLMGDTVFEPMGFDAFGIHSENYAMKIGEHPGRRHAPRGRQLPREPAEADRFDVRLEPPGQHGRPLVLPLDAVDLRAALQRRTHRVA